MGEKEYSWDEIKLHNKHNTGIWVVLGGRVYDVTNFMGGHPGGDAVLVENAGKDATVMFEDVGHSPEARLQMAEYYIGNVAGATLAPLETVASSSSKAGSSQEEKITSSSSSPSSSIPLSLLIPVFIILAALFVKYYL